MLGDFAEADDVAQETFVRLWRTNLPTDDQRRLLGLFGTLHGLVSLEINSHLAPGSVDGEALIVDRMTHALRHVHLARDRSSVASPEQ